MRSIILASTSPYRRELLTRLKCSFDVAAPDCDETPARHETASALVKRLAFDKASSLETRFPDSLIIGSDQVCDLEGRILGKPGTSARAIDQLTAMSGHTAVFRTGLCVLDTLTGKATIDEIDIRVSFRELDQQTIERYVSEEQPLDCAGSFRSEGLAVSLIESLECPDPTALIGLPLIRLSQLLREAHVAVP